MSVLYLLCRRPQLSQAGSQVLGTLTQLHGCSLIRHRGNGGLGRGHHFTTRLRSGKEKGNNTFDLKTDTELFNKNNIFPQSIKELPGKLNVAPGNNEEQRLNYVVVFVETPHSRISSKSAIEALNT